mgnify:CR=1 FL=1
MALETDARFLEHRPARIDAPLLAAVTSVLDEICVEVCGERTEYSLPNDIVKAVARPLGRGLKRHENHLRKTGRLTRTQDTF